MCAKMLTAITMGLLLVFNSSFGVWIRLTYIISKKCLFNSCCFCEAISVINVGEKLAAGLGAVKRYQIEILSAFVFQTG